MGGEYCAEGGICICVYVGGEYCAGGGYMYMWVGNIVQGGGYMYMWGGNTLYKRWPQLDLEDDTVHTETLILKHTAHTHTPLHIQTDMKPNILFGFLKNFKLSFLVYIYINKNIQLHAICSLNFFHCFRTVSCMLYSVSFIININDLILILITQFLYFCFFLYPVSHSMALSCISISFIFLYSESCILCPFCIKFMMFDRSIEWIWLNISMDQEYSLVVRPGNIFVRWWIIVSALGHH